MRQYRTARLYEPDVVAAFGAAASSTTSVTETLLDDLVGRYSAPERHYHGVRHIAAMLDLLAEHATGAQNRDALILAILYHDAIYDPHRNDNEMASAALAREQLARLAVPETMIRRVEALVLATRHAIVPPPDDRDAARLIDIDLAILAAPADAYRAYAAAIRREYAHVPDDLYRHGRAKVLAGFLARSRIFTIVFPRDLWDAAARKNLADEIAVLTR